MTWTEEQLATIEREHPAGMSVQQIVEVFVARGARLTEATFRKYVQLGLLPRSVRVGRKGHRRGSQGMYPASVVRQIDQIRRLMAQGYTIEVIQREFLFMRGDVEELERCLGRIYRAVETATERVSGVDEMVGHQLEEAKEHARELLARLSAIEKRMAMRARMARAAV